MTPSPCRSGRRWSGDERNGGRCAPPARATAFSPAPAIIKSRAVPASPRAGMPQLHSRPDPEGSAMPLSSCQSSVDLAPDRRCDLPQRVARAAPGTPAGPAGSGGLPYPAWGRRQGCSQPLTISSMETPKPAGRWPSGHSARDPRRTGPRCSSRATARAREGGGSGDAVRPLGRTRAEQTATRRVFGAEVPVRRQGVAQSLSVRS